MTNRIKPFMFLIIFYHLLTDEFLIIQIMNLDHSDHVLNDQNKSVDCNFSHHYIFYKRTSLFDLDNHREKVKIIF